MRCSWNIVWHVDVGSACVDRGQSPLMYLLTTAFYLFRQNEAVDMIAWNLLCTNFTHLSANCLLILYFLKQATLSKWLWYWLCRQKVTQRKNFMNYWSKTLTCGMPLQQCLRTMTQQHRVCTDIQMLFSQTFQDLQKRPNSRVFQDSKILFSRTFQDTFHSQKCVAWGQKVHIQNQISVYLHYSKEAKMQYLRLYYFI